MSDVPGSWLRRRVHILLRAVGGGEYSQPGDFVEEEDKYQVASLEALSAQVDSVVGTLHGREGQAMRLRFGLDDGVSRTLREAGLVMGITAERVRQLEAAGLERIRQPDRRARLPRALVQSQVTPRLN